MTDSADAEVLGIVGSYRRGGTIEQAVDHVLDAAQGRGSRVDKIRLDDLDVRFCTNCRGCMQDPGAERVPCVVHTDDDMEALLRRIDAARGIVLGAPVNLGGVNALTQRFMERCVGYGHWPWGRIGGPKVRSEVKRRHSVLISSSGAPRLFNVSLFGLGAVRSMRSFSNIIGAQVVDVVRIGPVVQPDAVVDAGAVHRLLRSADRLVAAIGAAESRRVA